MSEMGMFQQLTTRSVLNFFGVVPLHCRDDVAYIYYRSLKTLKAPADLIKFLGSLTGEMPENGSRHLGTSGARSRYEVSVLVQPPLRDWAHFLRGWTHCGYLGKNRDTSRRRHPT